MCVCVCVYVCVCMCYGCVYVDKLHVYMGVLHISRSCLYAKPKLETRRLLCDIASQIHADNYNTVRRTSDKIFMDTAGMLAEPIRSHCAQLHYYSVNHLALHGSYWYFPNSYIAQSWGFLHFDNIKSKQWHYLCLEETSLCCFQFEVVAMSLNFKFLSFKSFFISGCFLQVLHMDSK